MKYLRLFDTEAEYNSALLDLPNISFVKATGNVYYNGKHAVDRVLNAPLMDVCVARGWAKESENYLTYEEAAVVSTIYIQDLITYEVESAWEFKYFTGLTAISYDGLTGENSTKLKYLYIPDNYTGEIFSIRTVINNVSVILFPNIIKMHHSGNGGYPNYGPNASPERLAQPGWEQSILYLNSGILQTHTNSYLGFWKTIIAECSPFSSGDLVTGTVQQLRLYVKDEDVEAWQALTPWKRNPSSVKPISEYTGDMDY